MFIIDVIFIPILMFYSNFTHTAEITPSPISCTECQIYFFPREDFRSHLSVVHSLTIAYRMLALTIK
jgi:hypothetical protein